MFTLYLVPEYNHSSSRNLKPLLPRRHALAPPRHIRVFLRRPSFSLNWLRRTIRHRH